MGKPGAPTTGPSQHPNIMATSGSVSLEDAPASPASPGNSELMSSSTERRTNSATVVLPPPLPPTPMEPVKGILKAPKACDSAARRGSRRPATGRKVRFALEDGTDPLHQPHQNVSNADLSLDAHENDLMVASIQERPVTAEEYQMIMNLAGDAEEQHRDLTPPDDSTSEDSTKIDAAVDVITADYSVNPITLTFRSTEIEGKYVRFVIENKSFVAGKLYTLMSGVVSLVLLFPYLNFDLSEEKMTSFYVIFLFVSVALSWLVLALFFLNVTLPIREYLYFFSVAVHWPAFAGTSIMIKEDKAYRYAYTSGCFVFCCFIAQPRFVAMFPFLTLTPTVTLLAATFSSDDYWQNNNRMEIIWWVIPLFPLFILRIFEHRSREAFVENERGKALMDVQNQRSHMTKKLLARFFPLTATVRLLKTNGSEQYAVYPQTCLFFSTVDSFTEWAAQTSAEMVVSRVAQMFVAMEKLSRRYGVEKVYTIGDTYFGAIFPSNVSRRKLQLTDLKDSLQTSHTPQTEALPGDKPESDAANASRRGSEDLLPGEQESLVPSPSFPRPIGNVNAQALSGGVIALGEATEMEEDQEQGSSANKDNMSLGEIPSTNGTPTPNTPAAVLQAVPDGSTRRSSTSSSSTTVERPVSERCHRMLRFATAVRHHKDVMPVKIGVHVGAVIGGFVGIQPPKFDLFGAAVQRVKQLEQKGKKRRIHGSREITEAASELGKTSEDFEASDSHGQIFSSWRANREGGTVSAQGLVGDKEAVAAEFVEERALVLCAYLTKFGEGQRDKAMRGFETREALLRKSLARAQAVPRQLGTTSAAGEADEEELNELLRERDSSDRGSDVGEDAESRQLLLSDDEVLRIENPGDEKGLYTFSMLRLAFDDPQVEAQYINRLVKSQLSREVFVLFAVMAIFVVCGHVGNGCMHTTLNRLLPMFVIMILIVHIGYLHYVGTAHRWNFHISQVTYSILPWLASLMYQPGCGLPDEIHAGGNIIAMYFFLLVVSPSLSLEIRMPIRLAFLVINAAQFTAAIAVRRAIYRDDVLVWEFLPPAFVLAFSFMSLFADFTMRSGFQSTMRRRALQTNRSEYAEQTAEALEMMIPAFVIDRLLKAAKRGHVVDMSDVSSQSSGTSAATGLSAMSALSAGSQASGNGLTPRHMSTGDVAQVMLMRKSETVWPYARAVVMFVSFEPPQMAYDTISDTVMRIEAVARGRSIQKVKTINTTVLLVAGIDRSMSFEDAAVNVVEAALEIQRRVFPMHLTEGWKHRIGIHCGPIFGAVIGSQSLAFDIYGDTVNVASLIESTAPSNAVRCTAAVRQALPLDETELDFRVDPIALPVLIKGKGQMQVLHVQERERHRTMQLPVPHGTGSAPGANGAGAKHDNDTSSDPSDPSAYAESLRSSIRSAAMLPEAVPVESAVAFAFPTKSAFDASASASPFTVPVPLPSSQPSVPSAPSVQVANGNSRRTSQAATEGAASSLGQSQSTSAAATRGSGMSRADQSAASESTEDIDPHGTKIDRWRMQVFDDDIAGFTDEED